MHAAQQACTKSADTINHAQSHKPVLHYIYLSTKTLKHKQIKLWYKKIIYENKNVEHNTNIHINTKDMLHTYFK